MSHIFSSGEIIGRFTRDLQEFEVGVAVEAGYDESKSQLVLDLDCFLRLADIRAKNQRLVADWLPCKQTVRETVPRSEASDLAKDIFRRWAGKVRQSVPVPIRNY